MTLALAPALTTPLSPGHQAVKRRKPLAGGTACAGEPVETVADQFVEAQLRHDVLDSVDRDANYTVEPAVLVHGERARTDDDRIAPFDAKRLDLDIPTRRLHLAETRGERLWATSP